MRYGKWGFAVIGALFGWFGWGLFKGPSCEVAGLCLFYFPALAVSSLLHVTATDQAAVVITACLYGAVGFLVGWFVDRIFGCRARPCRS